VACTATKLAGLWPTVPFRGTIVTSARSCSFAAASVVVAGPARLIGLVSGAPVLGPPPGTPTTSTIVPAPATRRLTSKSILRLLMNPLQELTARPVRHACAQNKAYDGQNSCRQSSFNSSNRPSLCQLVADTSRHVPFGLAGG
jgi:hypothetical protein